MVETGPVGSAPTGVESAPAAAAIASVTPETRIANPSAIRLRLAASPGPAAEVMCRLLSVLGWDQGGTSRLLKHRPISTPRDAARRIDPFLRRLAPVARGQRAVALP